MTCLASASFILARLSQKGSFKLSQQLDHHFSFSTRLEKSVERESSYRENFIMIARVPKSFVCAALIAIYLGFVDANVIELDGAKISMTELSRLRALTQKLSIPERCSSYASGTLELINKQLPEAQLFNELSLKVNAAGNKSLASYLDECARYYGGDGVAASYSPTPDFQPEISDFEGSQPSAGSVSEIDQLRDQLDYERASARAEQQVIKAGLIRYELEIEKLKREVAAKDESLRRIRSGETEEARKEPSKCQLDLEISRGEQARALVRADSYLKEMLQYRGDLGMCEASLNKVRADRDQCQKDLAASSTVARTGLAAAFQTTTAAQCEAQNARLKEELDAISKRNVALASQYNELKAKLESAPRI